MGRLIRSLDWDAGPLGPTARWPQALQWAVRLVLDARQPMALWWGPELVAFYNDAFQDLLFSNGDPAVLGAPARQSSAAVWAFVAADVQQVLSGGEAVWHEAASMPRPDSQSGWWTYGLSPVSDGDSVGGVLLTATDVTRSPARADGAGTAYETVIDNMDEGFCVLDVLFDADAKAVDYRFLETNAAFAQQTGLQEVVGKRALELTQTLQPELLDVFGRTASTGQRQRLTVYSTACGRWLDMCTVRIGRPWESKVAVVLRDVNSQVRLSEALQESKALAVEAARRVEAQRQRLAAVLQAAPFGVFVADAQGVVKPFNDQARLEWQGVSMESRTTDEAWQGWWPQGAPRAGQPLEPADWPLARALAGENAPRALIELPSRRKRGERSTRLISAAPVRDASGAITGAVAASIDLTERMRAEAALKESDRRKDNFLAMLAHELRNPLAPIRTVAELLKAPHPAPEMVRRCGEIISRQVHHLVALVDDVTDLARITRGDIELHCAPVELQHVVSDAVEQVRPLIETRRHRLRLRQAAQPVVLHADSKRLVQVVSNLLTNAARYTPEGGIVTVRVWAAEGMANIAVEDTGIGMSAEFIAQAFDLFVQAKRSAERFDGGLGIGLTMVRNLVELHGGVVEASSPGEGLGSCFTVRLPCELRESAAPDKDGSDAEWTPQRIVDNSLGE